jgi:enamine deaminase RidA (YjgF/YER057c/UK114 family)
VPERTATRIALGVDEKEPYSKLVKYDGFVWIKSQIGTDDTGALPDDTAQQSRLALEHIEHALELAGTEAGKLVKINVYLADVDADYDAMNEVYDAFMRERGVTEPPARTTVGAPLSWPEIRVQMDAVAVE